MVDIVVTRISHIEGWTSDEIDQQHFIVYERFLFYVLPVAGTRRGIGIEYDETFSTDNSGWIWLRQFAISYVVAYTSRENCNNTWGRRVTFGDIPTECGGINQGDTLRVPQAPRGISKVDPDTRFEITIFGIAELNWMPY